MATSSASCPGSLAAPFSGVPANASTQERKLPRVMSVPCNIGPTGCVVAGENIIYRHLIECINNEPRHVDILNPIL